MIWSIDELKKKREKILETMKSCESQSWWCYQKMLNAIAALIECAEELEKK